MISGGRLIDAVLSELKYEGWVLKIAMNLLYSDVRASARLGDGKACHKEELHNVWQLLTSIKLFIRSSFGASAFLAGQLKWNRNTAYFSLCRFRAV